MRLYTSDPHFGHHNIIKYCNRPFKSVEEMDAVLLKNINSAIKDPEKDELIIAGDFAMARDREVVAAYRARINCKNVILVRGNHDYLTNEEYRTMFSCVRDMLYVKPLVNQKNEITICHYAMRTWNRSHKGSWHLYGHSHGTLPDDPSSLSFDIGVDCHSYHPLAEHEIKYILNQTKTLKQ